MFISLKRIIKTGWNSFRRQMDLSMATVFIFVMTICVITFLFLFQKMSLFVITQLQEKVDISVYFKKEAQESDVLKIKEEIAKMPEVKNVEYIPHQEAVKKFLQKNPELKESIEITEGLLNLSSLNIKTFEASQYANISNFLENNSFKSVIEKIDYYQRKPVIERIFSITSSIKKTVIVLSIILAILALLVAFNQVKLAIFNSREEIAVQRLVGASNWFIRGPFLIQGIISGFFAIVIAFIIFFLLVFFLEPKIKILIPEFSLFEFFTSNFLIIILLKFLSGIGLGVISSLIAIRKYLQI